MAFELAAVAPIKDRRVRRSRAALTRAAVELVTERGTAAVPLSEIAAAADVSRQLVYQHFGDRETLLLEAALDLVRTELLPRVAGSDWQATPSDARERTLAMTRHFAEHRVFYRAMLTSSSAFALNKALSGLLAAVNRRAIEEHLGDDLGPQQVEDLTRFITGGGAAVVNDWVTEADDPLDPDELADRLMGLADTVSTALSQTATSDQGTDR